MPLIGVLWRQRSLWTLTVSMEKLSKLSGDCCCCQAYRAIGYRAPPTCKEVHCLHVCKPGQTNGKASGQNKTSRSTCWSHPIQLASIGFTRTWALGTNESKHSSTMTVEVCACTCSCSWVLDMPESHVCHRQRASSNMDSRQAQCCL